MQDSSAQPAAATSPHRTSGETLPANNESIPAEKQPHQPVIPSIPFTWPTGRRAFRLYAFLFIGWIEVCIVPVVLFYVLRFDTHIANWITFAIITALWGFNIYWQLSFRSWYLFRKGDLRPLGVQSKWAFDFTAWTGGLATGVAVVMLVIGTIPTDVWVRVCAMAGPAILIVLSVISLLTALYNVMGRRAPFRLSSTAKGELVKPAAFYFVEDVLAVDGKGGRVLRQAIADRYAASPRFRRMLLVQTVFWALPMLLVAAGLTVIAVLHAVRRPVAFGVCKLSMPCDSPQKVLRSLT